MKRVTLYITDPQDEAIQRMADVAGVPFAEMLRRLLDDVLRRIREDAHRQHEPATD